MLRNVLPKKQKRCDFLENGGSPRVPRNSIEGPRDRKNHCFGTSKRRPSVDKTCLKVSPPNKTYNTKILPNQKLLFQKKTYFSEQKTSIEITIEEPGDLLGTLCDIRLQQAKTIWMMRFSFYE